MSLRKEPRAIAFVVPGPPVGKGRPRTGRNRQTGGVIHFTPRKTRDWEDTARRLGIEAMRGRSPISRPVSVDIAATLPVPKSWPKWKAEAACRGEILPTSKPDEDNIGKAAKDALNGIVIIDDSQIVSSRVTKRYGTEPRVAIFVDAVNHSLGATATRQELQSFRDRRSTSDA